jgi:riboflavin kinase/FMN adenylyltransferase
MRKENEMQTAERQKRCDEQACRMKITGRVVHGRGKGRTVGMPTVNLDLSTCSQLPPLGVYASLVWIGKAVWMGVTNVGRRPSVDNDQDITVETLILDFDRDVYGQEITVEFYAYLRPIVQMESLEAVKLQVEKDSLRVRTYFADRTILLKQWCAH